MKTDTPPNGLDQFSFSSLEKIFKSLNKVYDVKSIYLPKPEVQLIKHVGLQHAELVNNN